MDIQNFKSIYAAFALVLLISLNGFSQHMAKDSVKVNKFITSTVKKQPNAGLYTIAATKQTDAISAYIDAKQKQRKDTELVSQTIYESGLGMRLKKGDAAATSEILAMLTSNDSAKVGQAFYELGRNWDDTDRLVLAPEVKTLLFLMLENPETEESTMNFLGNNEVEGFLPIVEKRLFSGQSVNPDLALYWLSQDGNNERAADYIVAQYKKESFVSSETEWRTQSLQNFITNGSPTVKKKVLDIVYDFVQKNPLTASDTIRDQAKPGSGKLKVNMIVMYIKEGEREKVLPLTTNFVSLVAGLKKDVIPENQRELLIDMLNFRVYNPDERKRSVLRILNEQPEGYLIALQMVKEYPDLAGIPEVMDAVFSGFAYNYDGARSSSGEFSAYFPTVDQAVFDNYATKNISSTVLRQELTDAFALTKMTFEQHNDFLISIGLTNQRYSAADFEAMAKFTFYGEPNDIHTALRVAGIFVEAGESGMSPLDYDGLLDQFLNAAAGKLGNVKHYAQSHFDQKVQKWEYRLMVVSQGKTYVMVDEDAQDRYEMKAFLRLLDQLAVDRNLQERFIEIENHYAETGYVFGTPDNVMLLDQKYFLSEQIPVDEE